MNRLLIMTGVLGLAACTPTTRLSFPTEAIVSEAGARHYDVSGNGRIDFTVRTGPDGRAEVLEYDADEDGRIERRYRLSDYDAALVPHLVILLDSIPFEPIARAHAEGRLWCFNAPQKVIPPFPTMSGLIFSQMLGAPPTPGMINRHYDRRRGKMDNRITKRIFGWRYPWQLRLHYHPTYAENGLMFLDPRGWYPVELARIRKALDESPDRVTIVYVASTSGLLSKYGVDSLDEIIDGLQQLALQLLYDRNGAVKISVVADHGHTLMPPERIELDETLKAAGFWPTTNLRTARDVVFDIDGLVNYMGIHTFRPAAVADALLDRDEIELAMYQAQDVVLVRSAAGTAEIEKRGDRFRYRPRDADVLNYAPIVELLRREGAVDQDGFVADQAWFAVTVDHEWPDAPPRIWNAFHGTALNTPDVMVTMRDGYCIGLGGFDFWIDMASSHGGLNQVNSATIIMSTTDRVTGPVRTRDVFSVLEPDYHP